MRAGRSYRIFLAAFSLLNLSMSGCCCIWDCIHRHDFCLGRPVCCSYGGVASSSTFETADSEAPLPMPRRMPSPAGAGRSRQGAEQILGMPRQVEKNSTSLKPLPKPPALSTPPTAPRKTESDLEVTKSGPARVHVGKTAEYEIAVRNHGNEPATGVQLVDHLPAQLNVEQPPSDAQVSGNRVHWNIGTLKPDEEKKVTVTTRAVEVAAHVTNHATATSTEGIKATAATDTEITGTPGVLLEVFDLHDPIPVGQETEYLIRVTNQGPITLKQLNINTDCPDCFKRVSMTGMEESALRTASFKLPAFDVPSGQSRTFRLKLQALRAEDARVKVSLTGPDLRSPVVEEESTKIFAQD